MSNLGINAIGYLGISNTWMYGSNRIVFPDGLWNVPIVTMEHERSWFFGTTEFSSLCCVCCAGLILSFETSCIKLFFNCKCWRVMGLKWFVCIFMFSQLVLQMCVWRNCDVFLLLWKEIGVWDYFCFCSFFFFPFTSFLLLYKLEFSPEWCWASNQNILPSVVSHWLQ